MVAAAPRRRAVGWRGSPFSAARRRLTAYGAREMYGVVAVSEITTLEWALVVLFVVNFAWIAFTFTASVYGFVWLVRSPRLGALPQRLEARTAVVMPIYNEAPARVFAAVQAICEDVRRTGLGDAFDYFFLSDTTSPDIWIAEERALLAMRGALPGERIYYRRRRKNVARKAGNIADFVMRWGAAYPQMLVLDADSLMSGATIVRLAAAMEADPDAGIVQSVPLIVNRNTFFARLQQFAARIAGPVIAAGLSAWMGRDGNYWGHNAIIRTRAFADHCGMPDLPGTAAVRRPHPQPRFRRGGADPPGRLGGLHAADARRFLRGEPAVADRSGDARSALVSGQPAARAPAGGRAALRSLRACIWSTASWAISPRRCGWRNC